MKSRPSPLVRRAAFFSLLLLQQNDPIALPGVFAENDRMIAYERGKPLFVIWTKEHTRTRRAVGVDHFVPAPLPEGAIIKTHV